MTPIEKFLRCKPIKRQSELEIVLFELTLDKEGNLPIAKRIENLTGYNQSKFDTDDIIYCHFDKEVALLSQHICYKHRFFDLVLEEIPLIDSTGMVEGYHYQIVSEQEFG